MAPNLTRWAITREAAFFGERVHTFGHITGCYECRGKNVVPLKLGVDVVVCCARTYRFFGEVHGLGAITEQHLPRGQGRQ